MSSLTSLAVDPVKLVPNTPNPSTANAATITVAAILPHIVHHNVGPNKFPTLFARTFRTSRGTNVLLMAL